MRAGGGSGADGSAVDADDPIELSVVRARRSGVDLERAVRGRTDEPPDERARATNGRPLPVTACPTLCATPLIAILGCHDQGAKQSMCPSKRGRLNPCS
jgi:hypothetical protein